MAGISSFGSGELAGLVPDLERGPPQLRSLILNNTNVGDDAAAFIASCPHLEILGLGSTKFTSKVFCRSCQTFIH